MLASLGSARTRGQAAAVQSQLANMRAQAELYYSANGNSYSTVSNSCAGGMFGTSSSSNGLSQLITAVQNASVTPTCYASGTAWSVTSPLPGGTAYYCVDSTGYSGQRSTAFTNSSSVCQ